MRLNLLHGAMQMWSGFGTRLMLLASVLLQASGIAIIYSMVRSSWGAD